MKHALRSLLKSPGFTTIAVLTLALGIGANTTFFSVLYGVVLRGLPFPNAHELVELRNLGPALGSNNGQISLAELRDYRDRQHTLTGLAAYDLGRATLSLGDGAERVIQLRASANLLPLLGVQPAAGRNFTADEEHDGRDRVILVSHEFWQTHLGGTPDALGRTLHLNGLAHTVIGVLPSGFRFGEPGTALWKPLDFSSHGPADRTDHGLSTVGRLAPGVSLSRAREDFQRLAQQLQSDLPAAYPADPSWSLSLTPLRQSQFGHLLAPLSLLLCAAAAVLLVACVNVAIMFLLRAAVHRRAMMIRLALGASRAHIARHLLAESAFVSLLGAGLGLAFATAALELLKTFPPADIPRLDQASIDTAAAAFTTSLLLLVTFLVGLAPIVSIFKTPVVEGLAQAGRSTETRSAVRAREALTVLEIALAVLLLVGGSLALRSLQNLLRDDIGFRTEQLFTFKTNLTADAYPDLASAHRFYDQLTPRLESLPGVSSVAAVSYLPLSGESQFQAATPLAHESTTPVAWRVVRGPYFSTMGSTLRHGRFFNDTDRAGSPPVVIVDDAFARRFWPNTADALGQPVRFGPDESAEPHTIVGVVHHLKHAGPGQPSLPEAYVPQSQFYQRGMYTVVKTSQAAALAPLVRAQIAAVDPSVPMYFVETMAARHARTLAFPRFAAGLIGAFALLALVLAGVGLFGVTAYSVTQRSREFGIRFALGAQRSHVVALVFGRVGRLAVIGAALGGLGAFALSELMTGLLFGVEPTDPFTLAAATALVALTALAASLLPLARALRVNPADALRAE